MKPIKKVIRYIIISSKTKKKESTSGNKKLTDSRERQKGKEISCSLQRIL
jgi:hypothetical protein